MDFYVGWAREVPRAIARPQRLVAGLFVVLGLAASVVFTASSDPLPASHWEFGSPRSFEGFVVADPYPSLLIPRPGSETELTRYLLVAPNKFGAVELVEDVLRSWVSVEATLLYRDHRAVLEVVPDSFEPVSAPSASRWVEDHRPTSLGALTVEGEVVEAKCHMGAMIPGEGVAHRACTAHCLEGGIPPLLHVVDEAGHPHPLVLVGEGDRTVGPEVAKWAGHIVGVTGEGRRSGDWTFLEADLTDVERLER